LYIPVEIGAIEKIGLPFDGLPGLAGAEVLVRYLPFSLFLLFPIQKTEKDSSG
jgi:hypothetical protein